MKQKQLIEATIDEIMFVILLLAGFCAPSSSFPFVYHFVNEPMTWNDAQSYCIAEHAGMAQILDTEYMAMVMSTPAAGYTDKAWIGLYENMSEWTWVNGLPATYSSWGSKQPDNVNASEFCVSMTEMGLWMDYSCSEKKPAVCFIGQSYVSGYSIDLTEKTWTEAKTSCENQFSILATVPDETTNYNIRMAMMQVSEAWIGLSRPELWYWSETGEPYSFINWQLDQPDNLNGQENCAAMVVKDGTWTDEWCNAKYPFFCYEIYKSKTTVVRMKIQSSANMDNPALSANLKQQLHEAFARHGVTDVKLTWKKLPVKQTQESIMENSCLFVL